MTNPNDDTISDALRFMGAVYHDANADIGTNPEGERVVRIDLTAGRGIQSYDRTVILTVDTAIALRNHLDAAFAAAGVDDDPGADVDPEDACPNCGERRQDLLVWFENADQVQCESCGHVYAPRRAAKTAGEPRSEPRSW
ncbi:MAG: hypothetical protein AB1601_14110 [Planctomycetota bacterium]